MAELAFAAAAAEDTYAVAVADVGAGLHNWYKLNKNTNGLVQVTNALMLLVFIRPNPVLEFKFQFRM